MVRAGVVVHPREWMHSGYSEIQSLPKRYSIIDRVTLAPLSGGQGADRGNSLKKSDNPTRFS